MVSIQFLGWGQKEGGGEVKEGSVSWHALSLQSGGQISPALVETGGRRPGDPMRVDG